MQPLVTTVTSFAAEHQRPWRTRPCVVVRRDRWKVEWARARGRRVWYAVMDWGHSDTLYIHVFGQKTGRDYAVNRNRRRWGTPALHLGSVKFK